MPSYRGKREADWSSDPPSQFWLTLAVSFVVFALALTGLLVAADVFAQVDGISARLR